MPDRSQLNPCPTLRIDDPQPNQEKKDRLNRDSEPPWEHGRRKEATFGGPSRSSPEQGEDKSDEKRHAYARSDQIEMRRATRGKLRYAPKAEKDLVCDHQCANRRDRDCIFPQE